jgi:pyruvate dehydrogenase E2 component (dihydrolipoamide acetyltransferase)
MARIEVVMPQMGESITEGTIVKWHKKVGDPVARDETLLEISTDKVDSEIPSPASGVLAEILVGEQKTVAVKTVIAYLESDGPDAVARPVASPPAAAAAVPVAVPAVVPAGGRFISPLVLSIARTEGVSMTELEQIAGSGEGGRVTKKDLLAYVQRRASGAAAATRPGTNPAAPGAPPAEAGRKYPSPDYDVVRMTNVQQKMAQHMVESVRTSPHVAAVHEVDMAAVVKHRTEHAAAFEQKEAFKLTFMPYIAHAVVKAIKKYPLINSTVDGDTIVRKNFINLGFAVASESGLLVPVIKHAEEKSFLGLARAINDLATRTRAKKLTPDDIQGGTFTISNYGVFGTMIGTPIINQPQVAILGTGAVEKRVVVINEALAIRPIAYFTMSFDHRVVDGALGGMFLEEIVQGLEQWSLDVIA